MEKLAWNQAQKDWKMAKTLKIYLRNEKFAIDDLTPYLIV